MWGQNMKTVRIVCLAAIGMMFTTVAQAKSPSNTGTIHFVGQVVEGACGTTMQKSAVQISCYRDGAVRTQRVTANPQSDGYLLQNIGTVSQRSISGHPELQEMTITYL